MKESTRTKRTLRRINFTCRYVGCKKDLYLESPEFTLSRKYCNDHKKAMKHEKIIKVIKSNRIKFGKNKFFVCKGCKKIVNQLDAYRMKKYHSKECKKQDHIKHLKAIRPMLVKNALRKRICQRIGCNNTLEKRKNIGARYCSEECKEIVHKQTAGMRFLFIKDPSKLKSYRKELIINASQ